ncbi:hypothetical protein H8356DRAFT_1754574 [Neocallimastix lanati (nom. inval.)]|nr:hypothetical protein H8356DRAFT_1754574 [Neocallimastix sp. JGI-2020a]
MENLTTYYNEVIEILCSKSVQVFNNNYNLNINKDNILNNLTKEDDIQSSIHEMAKLSLNNTCIGLKRNKTTCNNKVIPGHMYCGVHVRSEGKLPLNQYISNVATTLKYGHPAVVVSLGNNWIFQKDSQNNDIRKNESKSTKWPLSVDMVDKSLHSYILFFDEFKSYFGAGILVIQYCSTEKNKKQNSYFMATHYVEVSRYGEELQPEYYIKMTFKSIALIKEKPIFSKIKEFLSEYGIPYDINEINKRNSDIIENNPVVIYNKINKIINDHYNTFYYNSKSYITLNINSE